MNACANGGKKGAVGAMISCENVKSHWVLCPVCGGKTRLKILEETELKHFPLFCPKCRRETLVSAAHFRVSVVEEGAE